MNPKILSSNPIQLKKEEKFKVLPGRSQNQLFHGFKSESTSETLGQEFYSQFSGTETSGLTKTSETRTEVTVDRTPENFTKFRAKMNYYVVLPKVSNSNKSKHWKTA
jgi:hypothetical protein